MEGMHTFRVHPLRAQVPFMLLSHLSLTNYRNFVRLDADIAPGITLLIGGNAQGKTSLLEAIYFLATFTAFSTGDDRQVINFVAGEENLAVARIVAEYRRGDRTHHMEVRLIQERRGPLGERKRLRKEVLLDGVRHKVSAMLGRFNAVLFLPHMLQIIEGAPEIRRRHLDMTLSQVIPRYPQALSRYRKALAQRNALLKALAERSGETNRLDYWDAQLAEAGAHIIQARIRAIDELERLAVGVHRELSRGAEVLRLVYRPSYDPVPKAENQYALPLDAAVNRSHLSLDTIQERFVKRLLAERRNDIARGVTTIGPHRDDLLFLANGIHLGHYGSRGQVRTAMLSLKLAEVDWMHQHTGEWPILLLDEMLAELDPNRRDDLLRRLLRSEQVFATATDLTPFPETFTRQVQLWRITAGQLEAYVP